jgi:uncharacterized protein YjbI with pentapeptide repeats
MAKLYKANLQNADLSDARDITYEMLLNVRSLYMVKGLDPQIEARLKKSIRGLELFEKPRK